jgi:hypothetical protein
VCTSPVVQAAWAAGQQLSVYGVIYALKDGLLRKLVGPVCRWAAAAVFRVPTRQPQLVRSRPPSQAGTQGGTPAAGACPDRLWQGCMPPPLPPRRHALAPL